MKRAYLEVTNELIRALLQLPDTVTVSGCERASAFGNTTYVFLEGTHDALPDVGEGMRSSKLDLEDFR